MKICTFREWPDFLFAIKKKQDSVDDSVVAFVVLKFLSKLLAIKYFQIKSHILLFEHDFCYKMHRGIRFSISLRIIILWLN